jgi:hypothetical protein
MTFATFGPPRPMLAFAVQNRVHNPLQNDAKPLIIWKVRKTKAVDRLNRTSYADRVYVDEKQTEEIGC